MENNLDNLLALQKEMNRKKVRRLIPLVIIVLLLLVFVAACCLVDMGSGMTDDTIALLCAVVILAAVMVVPLVIFLQKQKKIHKSIQNLPLGDQMQINQDCIEGQRYMNAVFCKNYLLIVGANAIAIPYKEIVWIYGRSVNYTSGLIPIYNMTSIQVHDQRNKMHEINPKMGAFLAKSPLKSLDAQMFMEKIHEVAPWVYLGSDHKMSFKEMAQTAARMAQELSE